MKQFILLFVFLFTTNLFAQVPNYVPKNGLMSWWGFNGNANDESGNGNHGITYGPILSSDRFGKIESAYKFFGNTDLIGTTNSLIIGNNYSVSFWTQIDSMTAAWLIVHGGKSGYSSQFDKGTRVVHPNGVLQQYTFTGQQQWLGSDTLIAGPNKWYHIVYGQSSSGVKLYINSKLVASNNLTTNQSRSGFWRFGGCTHSGQNSLFGRLDDIGIWNRELTESEITDLYNSECSLNIMNQPKSKTSRIGGGATFIVKSNDVTANVKWQTKVAGLDWMELIESNTYKNVSSDSLVLSNITLSNHNQLFRSIINNEVCKDTSEIVSLTVIDTCIAIRTDTVKVIINDTVRKVITDTVKVAVSDTLKIKTKATGIQEDKYYTFLIYPNPTNSYVIIDCGDQAEVSSYSFVITNSLGQEKVSSKFSTRFQQIDISGIGGAGLYIISIRDGNNTVIETRKLLIQ